MQDLFKRLSRRKENGIMETQQNLQKFLKEAESIKNDLKEIDNLHRTLDNSNTQAKTLHNATSIKRLRATMDATVSRALTIAKLLKLKLESLDRSNSENRTLPGCGQGSSADRTRTAVVNGLWKKLRYSMESFNALREKIVLEYKETVEKRYFTVTGEVPDDRTVEILLSTGECESLYQKGVRQRESDTVSDTEVRERYDAATEMERRLLELHRLFVDMTVLVVAQGDEIDDIESHVGRATSFVRGGTENFSRARRHRIKERKWACVAVALLILVVLLVLIIVFLSAVISKEVFLGYLGWAWGIILRLSM